MNVSRFPEATWTGLPIWQFVVVLGMVALLGAIINSPAVGRPAKNTLTRESYQKNCLLCHKTAPYGIAPEIVAGLAVRDGPSARELMPNTKCWRRCVKCWPQRPAVKAK